MEISMRVGNAFLLLCFFLLHLIYIYISVGVAVGSLTGIMSYARMQAIIHFQNVFQI